MIMNCESLVELLSESIEESIICGTEILEAVLKLGWSLKKHSKRTFVS